MDILSDAVAVVRTGRPTSGMFIRHAPWGREYPVQPGAGFHVVLQGSCWLMRADAEPIPLGVGDVVFMARGADHTLADDPRTPITEVARPGEPREVAGVGARCALLCGAYELDRRRNHPLLADLPEFIHLPARLGRHPSLRMAVDLLAAEITEPRPGGDAVIPALLDTLLLYILRAWFDEHADAADAAGWTRALGDSAVSTALRAIHDAPEAAWNVAELSAAAGVSRATLARRFAATVGEPPLSYLTRWRLLVAARLLRDTDAALATVARKVGYSSEFAFAKAFKREYGQAPGHYRKGGETPALVAV